MNREMLDALSDEELQQTARYAQELLRDREQNRKRQAIEQARATLAAAGVSFDELLASGRAGKRGKERPNEGARALHAGERYVNPADASQSWTVGKGRKPKWFGELERSGGLPAPAMAPG